jgi:hypothetical protein
MSEQLFDIDTVGYKDGLGSFFDFYINNTFYLLAPKYYFSLYSTYFSRCLACYDGYTINANYNIEKGFVPQKMLQSIATGLSNMVFAKGIDFSGDKPDYNFITKWSDNNDFNNILKKCFKFAIAGGTSLLKVNRNNKDLYVTTHRIDTFYPSIDSSGKIVDVKVYFDAITDINNATSTETHFGICEERYFDKNGKAMITNKIYKVVGNVQTSIQSRRQPQDIQDVPFFELPQSVKNYIKEYYPDILIGKPQYLPFNNSLGCVLFKFTEDIPQFSSVNFPFGQPIADILFTENYQYDQEKYFEKNEVDLARARALIPEEMWNLDDPDYDKDALSERFYQKVGSNNGDSDKITPLQFGLRAEAIATEINNILNSIAFKLNVSASQVASFLNEGNSSKTATEIINERTKSDTFISSEIKLNEHSINEILRIICYYYNHNPVKILFKSEDQSPFLDKLKTYSDVFSSGNMSPERFVKDVYKNLSQEEQQKEIDFLTNTKEQNNQLTQANIQSWTKK